MKSDELQHLERTRLPPLLREIPDPPKKLYLRGTMPPQERKWLTVVGSRALSAYGRQACEFLIEGLRGYPIVIVSGLAFGTDAWAHKVSLGVGLPCVAVPGSGLDWSVLYPRSNYNLAKEIVKAGGALVSEFEPMQKAADYTFPRRNRIMVGLTHATLVIEAKERSGSLITARLATEYNRELLVVPGSIFSETSKGTHQFLKLGATAVTEPVDILKALNLPVDIVSPQRDDLSEREREVFEILASPCSREEIFEKLELPVTDTNILLSSMEIKGLIREELGMVRRA